MKKRITFTQEEKELDKQDTLEMLKQGISQNEIARQLGKSAQYISNIKTELVNSGVITQAEIDKIRQEKIEKSNKEKNVNKEIATKQRESNKQSQLDKIYNEIKNNVATIQISKKLKIPRTTLNRYIEELIQQGKITSNDVILQKNEEGKKTSDRDAQILADVESGNYKIKEIAIKYNMTTSNIRRIIKKNKSVEKPEASTYKRNKDINPNVILTYKERDVKNWILQGYQYSYIAKKLNVTEFELSKVVQSLRQKHAINSELINKARQEKRKRDDNLIIEYIKQGLSQNEVSKKLQEYQVGNVSMALNRLKLEGRITDEEIQSALDSKPNDFKALVLAGMQQGLITREIIDSDKSRICH